MTHAMLGWLVKDCRAKRWNGECFISKGFYRSLLVAIVQKTLGYMTRAGKKAVYDIMETFRYDIRMYYVVSGVICDYVKDVDDYRYLEAYIGEEVTRTYMTLTKYEKSDVLKILLTMDKVDVLLSIFEREYKEGLDFHSWFLTIREFFKRYPLIDGKAKEHLLQLCYDCAKKDSRNVYQNMLEVFDYATSVGCKDAYVNQVVHQITENIPLMGVTDRDGFICKKMYEYESIIKRGRVQGRVALANRLCELLYIEKQMQKDHEAFHEYIKHTSGQKLSTSGIAKEEIGPYLKKDRKSVV